MKKFIYIYITLLVVLVGWQSPTVHAQATEAIAEIEDPFSKPELWAKLNTSPQDDYLWKMYFGKDLFDLTTEQYKMYESLRNHLIAKEEKKNEAMMQKIYQERNNITSEGAIVSLRDDVNYQELVSNVSKNFALIEAFFTQKFEQIGSEYVSYYEMYPNSDYNHTQWVDEHESRLEELIKMNSQDNNMYSNANR